MSIPIRYCQLVKAADDAEYFAKFHPIMKRNLECGHFSIYPCPHDPQCRELTDEEGADLLNRFKQPTSEANRE